MADTKFHLESRLRGMPDIQRKYFFEVIIPDVRKISTRSKTEDLIIRCKQVSIPGRGNEPIESNFMGMKQYFPGRANFPGVLNITFEETQDMSIMKTFWDWREKLLGVGELSTNPGFGGAVNKRAVCSDVYIQMYKFDGTKTDNKIRVVNCWPQEVPDSDLAYAANEAVTYQIGIRYDFWEILRS